MHAERGEAPPHGLARGPAALATAVAAAVALLLRVPFLRLALASDEAYQSAVARMWLAGKHLYGDLAVVRPPLLTLPFAAARLLGQGGPGELSLRAMAAVWSAATVAVLAWFLLRRLRLWPALGGIALAVLWSASLALQNEANAETWLLLPYTVGALLLLALAENRAAEDARGARDAWLAVAAGALIGASLLFKQPAIVAIALPLATAAAYPGAWRAWLVESAAFVAGVVAAFALSLAWSALSGDAIAYLWRAWLGMYAYVSSTRSRTAAQALTGALTGGPAFFAPAGLVLAAGIVAWPFPVRPLDRGSAYARFAWVWLALSLVGASASSFFFRHYFIQTAPALVLLAAASLHTLAEKNTRRGRMWVAATAIGLAIALSAAGWGTDVVGLRQIAAGRNAAVMMASRLDSVTRPGATALVWGGYQAVSGYTARVPYAPAIWGWYGFFDKPGTSRFLGQEFPSKGTLLLDRLRSGPLPDAIVLTTPLSGTDPRDVDDPRIAPEIALLIRQDYRVAAAGHVRGKPWVLWVRR